MTKPATRACVSLGCLDADSDSEEWEVAGISNTGRVEWWCRTCARKLAVQHYNLERARLARQAERAQAAPAGPKAAALTMPADSGSDDNLPSRPRPFQSKPIVRKGAPAIGSDDSDLDVRPAVPRTAPKGKETKPFAAPVRRPPTAQGSDSDDDLPPPRKPVTSTASKAGGRARAGAVPKSSRPAAISDDSDDARPAKPIKNMRQPRLPAHKEPKRPAAVDSESD